MQPPHDIHGPAALKADVIRSAEKCIRRCAAGVLLELAHKQEYFATLFLVVDVSLTGRRIDAGRRPALPME